MRKIDLDGWALIPGPESDPPASSLTLSNLVEYPPEFVVEAILTAFPEIIVENSGEPSWLDWRAKWKVGDDQIEVGMSLLDTDPVSWGGSSLHGVCTASRFLEAWKKIRQRCPGVWMHNNDCEIHTPETFAELFRR
jgi:hypothetical protein